ncbi:MAG TPA: hypothetical protein DCG34_09215 [Clostridiales bacterium]|jgi:hypothetical protein|nr:hypothetical protein [Clostridiales bacterium]
MKKIIKRLLFSIVIFIITYSSVEWAKKNNDFIEIFYSGKLYPLISSNVSAIFSFSNISIGEIVLTIGLIGLIILFVRFFIKPSIHTIIDILSGLFATAAILYLAFWLMWGLNNFRLPLEENIGYEVEKLTIQDLENTAIYLIERINELEDQMVFDADNLPVYHGDIKEILKNSSLYFDDFAENHSFLTTGRYSRPKPMVYSEIMSHLNYTGIYNPFTAEANLNVRTPRHNIPFIAMHEISHQRGIAGEREANFIAFLASVESGDYYFKYSGYVSALNYVINAIYNENQDKYFKLVELFSINLRAVYKNNAEYWQNYQTVVSDIGEINNDIFLKSTGQSEGTKSYGLVVDLIASYVKTKTV